MPFSRLVVDPSDATSFTRDLLQDDHGFMWFATGDGLFRYDGYKFTLYTIGEDRRGDLITPLVLLEAEDGGLWVGTDSGLCYLDTATRAYTYFPRDVDARGRGKEDRVTSLILDEDGFVWMGSQRGLFRFNPMDQSYQQVRPPDEMISRNRWSISALSRDGAGGIWVGSYHDGLLHLNPFGEVWRQYKGTGQEGALGYKGVSALHLDRSGELWVGTFRGLYSLRLGDDLVKAHKADPKQLVMDRRIRSLMETSDGKLWVGSREGLYEYNRARGSFTAIYSRDVWERPLQETDVTALFEDRSGLIWVGTGNNALLHHKPPRIQWEHGLSEVGRNDLTFSNSVLSMAGHGSGLWLGLFEGGLMRRDLDGGEEVTYWSSEQEDELVDWETVSAIAPDDSGTLWLGTNNALVEFRPDEGQVRKFRHEPGNPNTPLSLEIYALTLDPRGYLWVGGNRGLSRLDLERGTFTHYPPREDDPDALQYNRVSTLLLDDEERLWVGTRGGGLFRLDAAMETFIAYPSDLETPGALPDSFVNDLFEDSEGHVWIATDNGPAMYQPERDDFLVLGRRDGLFYNEIKAIEQDAYGAIWFSAFRGIARLDLQTGSFALFPFDQPPNSNEFTTGASLQGPDGRIYFGGVNGYHAFNPSEFLAEGTPPTVAVTDFRLLNKSVPISREDQPTPLERPIYETERIQLDYDDLLFSFEFSVLDFAQPNRNTFAYKLTPYNDDWIYTSADNRFAAYTNLNPGTYTFRVKGADKDGIWNDLGAEIEIYIKPPFWRTWWFYTIEAILLVALLVGGFIAQRNHLRRKKEEELRALEAEREQQEALARMELKRKTEELEFARQVQVSMLPSRDIIGTSVDVVGSMRTASEVGGDYFDFIDMSEGRGCIVCGDATGHGVTAGLIVGMTKSALITLVENTDHGPAELMRHLNHTLKQSITQKNIGMGMSVNFWDPETHTLRISSAGMPFPLLYRAAEDSMEPVVLKCPPLGFLRRLPLQEQAFQLKPGDTVVWLSDGFGERCNGRGTFWSSADLVDQVTQACRTAPDARGVAAAVIEACDTFAEGNEPDDDMTVVVMRVKA